MKILLHGYNTCMQNVAGGVATTINGLRESLKENYKDIEITLFSPYDIMIKDYDILHIYKITPEAIGIIEYAKKHNIKVVVSSVVSRNESFKVKINLFLSKLLPITTGIAMMKHGLDMADVIVTETKVEEKYLIDVFKIQKDKIQVVENAVDIQINKGHISKMSYAFLNNKKYVLCVGRFDENKNQYSLIKALKNTDIPVVFVGAGRSEDDEYYLKCKSAASSNMVFLGWIDHNSQELIELFENAHVVVCPSFDETFGITVVEGAIAGANIAISESIVLNDCITSIAHTFNPNKIKHIKEAVLAAYDSDKDVRDIDYLKKHYSRRRYAAEYYCLYKDLLK